MGYGNGVSIERLRFDLDREALTVDYSIVPEDEDHTPYTTVQGLDELHAIREHKRLTRSVECALPAPVGWDVQIATKASSEQVAQLPWTAQAKRNASPAQASTTTHPEGDRIGLGIKHAALPDDHSVLKVRVVIELSGSSSGIRLNGIPQPIEQVEERDPQSQIASQQMLRDASSAADFSFNTQSSSVSTVAESASKASAALPERPALMRAQTERTAAAEKSILSRVKRNYIYFSSLLQEPEAKWKRSEYSFFRLCTLLDGARSHRSARCVDSAARFNRSNIGRVPCRSNFRWVGSMGLVRCSSNSGCSHVLGQTL